VIYVNSDSKLENFKKSDQIWKVRLTEEEFSRRCSTCRTCRRRHANGSHSQDGEQLPC